MRALIIAAVLLLLLPYHVQAQSLQPSPPPEGSTDIPQGVEEPDSVPEPDAEDMDTPPAPEKPAPKPVKEKAKKEAPANPNEAGDNTSDEVVLHGLNKVTAQVSTIDAPIGSVVRFGTIEIIAHSCWKSAPEDSPENAALLEVSEVKQGEPPKRIFLGWMFSSSPGLSSLEHPFYDLTVVECKKEKL